MDVAGMIDAYLAAWNAPDPLDRAVLLRSAVADDCLYHGPVGRADGVAELAAMIAETRDMVPGASVRRVGSVEPGTGAELVFRWAVDGPDGSELMQGVDVVTTAADGRLQRIGVVPGG